MHSLVRLLLSSLLLAATLTCAQGCKSGGGGRAVAKPGHQAAASDSVVIERLPATVEEFFALRDRTAGSPRGGAAMFVVALALYAQDAPLGLQCLTIAADQSRLQDGGDGYQGRQIIRSDLSLLRSQIDPKPYVARSYFQGTSPASGYALPSGPLEVAFGRVDEQGATAKVWVRCTGADNDRPVTLAVNDKGVWKAKEWSSLIVGVRKPEVKQDDPF